MILKAPSRLCLGLRRRRAILLHNAQQIFRLERLDQLGDGPGHAAAHLAENAVNFGHQNDGNRGRAQVLAQQLAQLITVHAAGQAGGQQIEIGRPCFRSWSTTS